MQILITNRRFRLYARYSGKTHYELQGVHCQTNIDSISNNPSFHLKHLGVPDGSDSSDGTSYPLMENCTLSIAQATSRIAYSPPLLCAWYTHHQNDTCVTLFAGAAVMLYPFTQRVEMFMPFFGR